MSYVIAGRTIKNEYLALTTLLSTVGIASWASSGGGKKNQTPASASATESLIQSAKGTFKSEDEEAFIRDFIANANAEEGAAKH